MLSPRRLVRLLPLLLLQALLLPGPSTAFRVLDENQPPTNTTIVLGYNSGKYTFGTKVSPLGSASYRISLYSLRVWLQYLANTTDLLPGATVQLVANPFKGPNIADAIVTTLQLLDRGVIGIVGSSFSSATKLTTMLTEQSVCPSATVPRPTQTCPTRQSTRTSSAQSQRQSPNSSHSRLCAEYGLASCRHHQPDRCIRHRHPQGIPRRSGRIASQDHICADTVSQLGIIPDGSYNASSWEAYLDNIRDSNVLLFSCLPLRTKSRVFSKPPRSVA
ncbi:hypothetical protein BC831DRAFT_218974 [Entophlyctis helioformis]|nr:hypothetical protein BC831DRAFT_218974 [Entophlyctis helioformis]